MASVGTDGASACRAEHMREDVLSVPLGRAASSHSIPASALEHHTCCLSGTGRFMRDMAGTQTKLLWAYTQRCTGFCKTSASWAWCTAGRRHPTRLRIFITRLDHPSHLAWLCVLVNP